MLAEERFSQILALLAEKRTATVQELCEALNASESTIRRDLLELDRQGLVNKVHGGATLPSGQFRADEPTMEAKETLAVGQKAAIAQAAAALTKIKTNAVMNILFIKTLQFLHNFFYYNTNSVFRHSIVYPVFFRKNTFNGNLSK